MAQHYATGHPTPHRRTSRSLYPLLGLILLLFASPLWSQPAPHLQAILKHADDMERAGKWSDVIKCYESAIKDFPADSALTDRLVSARMHHDIARRYRDSSFIRDQLQLTPRRALDVYTEVLNKIETYYVERPQWSTVVKRGLRQIDEAFEEPLFRKHHPTKLNASILANYQHAVREKIDTDNIERLADAREAAWSASHLAHHYLGITPQAAMLEFISAATGSLDRYSAYLTPNQLEEVFSQIEGSFVGIGIELKSTGDDLEIVSVIPGGPAAEAGILAGQHIVAIAGKRTSAATIDADADRLKGQQNSFVNLIVQARDGNETNHRLARRLVDVPSVDRIQWLDRESGIVYFRLASFQKSTSKDVDQVLWDLQRKGMQFLVIDLRGNPGGLLTAAVDLADKFLSEGAIVSTRGRSPQEDYKYLARAPGTWNVPLAVLVDRNSASASEIFAAAIGEHQRGLVVGERSYGKGSVQGIFPLSMANCGLRLTTAKFYSPTGRPISHQGIVPNVVVHQVSKPIDDASGFLPSATRDAGLQAALKIAQNELGLVIPPSANE